MNYIELGKANLAGFTIMIFTEGTILKPKSWFKLYQHKSYIPIGNCMEIIKGWWEQGANIVYCTSRRGKEAEDISSLLRQYGFVGDKLYFRNKGEKYRDIVEKIHPTILIEDDCKSIGGAWQMCITKVAPQVKEKITSIVIREFMGIDHLPRNLLALSKGITD